MEQGMSTKLENLPVLPGWITLGQAAELLGISRQHAYRRARLANEGSVGGWKTVHRLGDKPSYVVSSNEVLEEISDRR